MNISNKEKIMLYVLGIVLIGVCYFNFVYTPLVNKAENIKQEKQRKEQEYNDAMETINLIDDRRSDAKILKAKVIECSKSFYPVLSEEHIIVELDKLITDSGLKGAIQFEPIVSEAVESEEGESVIIAESTLQSVSEKYKSTVPDEDNKSEESNSTTDNSNQNDNNNTENNNDNKNATNTDGNQQENKEDTIHKIKATINFQGTYEALDKFLNSVEGHTNKIVINSISIGQDSINGINGTMKVEIYAIPKIDDEMSEYLQWNFNNTYGKTVPFSTGMATGVKQNKKVENDFVMATRSINSDLPAVVLGKGNDNSRVTYVYADKNEIEDVEIKFTQKGNAYYYKYKTSKEKYPKQYNDNGVQFIPEADGNISINILSESRFNSEDKSGVNLKIINETDRLVKVNINGDDASNPRVTIEGDSSKVSVDKK